MLLDVSDSPPFRVEIVREKEKKINKQKKPFKYIEGLFY